MSRLVIFSALLGCIPASVALAANPDFARDLKASISLQGHPCDQVVNAKRNADSDYVATCRDGNRYHVWVNAEGRVCVDKL